MTKALVVCKNVRATTFVPISSLCNPYTYFSLYSWVDLHTWTYSHINKKTFFSSWGINFKRWYHLTQQFPTHLQMCRNYASCTSSFFSYMCRNILPCVSFLLAHLHFAGIFNFLAGIFPTHFSKFPTHAGSMFPAYLKSVGHFSI